MVQDPHRGYIVETILAKLKTLEKIFKQPNRFQIVGMSATLSGLETLKKWLHKTEVYESRHRPCPLTEYTLDLQSSILFQEPEPQHRVVVEIDDLAEEVKAHEKGPRSQEYETQKLRKPTNLKEVTSLSKFVRQQQGKQLVNLNSQVPLFPDDRDFLATVTCAYVRKKKAVLVFCPTRDGCSSTALKLSQLLPVQYVEYTPPPRVSGTTKPKPTPLAFSDLVSELQQIVKFVFTEKSKGKTLNREQVFDRALQEERLRLIEELK